MKGFSKSSLFPISSKSRRSVGVSMDMLQMIPRRTLPTKEDISKFSIRTISSGTESISIIESGTGTTVNDSEVFEAWIKSKRLKKPKAQLSLTEAELREDISVLLTQKNTDVIENLVIYSFKENCFVPYLPEPTTVELFNYEGTLACNDLETISDLIEETESEIENREIRRRLDELLSAEYVKPKKTKYRRLSKVKHVTFSEDPNEEQNDEEDQDREVGGEEGDGMNEAVEQEGEEEIVAPQILKKRKLVNQFNFCERAALTYSLPYRSVETQTMPPPRSQFGDHVQQWIIYDAYIEDYAEQLKEREKEKRLVQQNTTRTEDILKEIQDRQQYRDELNRKFLQTWQILERMVNQNIFDEVAYDYRYYEDPSDEFREHEGTLLPLWKFFFDKTNKKLGVTDLCFNTFHYDLFAVTYGSFDCMKQYTEGAVCLFTMKNPSFPDFKIALDCGVMCCDIHPKYPNLLAIGMYDGNVAVFNLQGNHNKPLYTSQGDNKHAECVAQVKWGPDMADGEINFYSVSSDGRVFNWVLMQNRLSITTMITLYIDRNSHNGPDGLLPKLRSCGSCMTFHPTQPEIFLVGTEEGLIYKCNTAYSTKYLAIYEAHYLSIYCIDYNKYNSNIFISCSADWRVKVWEDMRFEPLFVFDLGVSAGDVKWAPYSSTVFGAVSADGKVHVFDLNVDKYRPICVQGIVQRRRCKLTRLAFNKKLSFIIVGDDKGTTYSLKLSPNLRLQVKPPKKQQSLDQHTLQVQKLEKLLTLVRELPEGDDINEKDTTTTNY